MTLLGLRLSSEWGRLEAEGTHHPGEAGRLPPFLHWVRARGLGPERSWGRQWRMEPGLTLMWSQETPERW